MSRARIASPVRIGVLGAGFVADFYPRALRHVRGHEVSALVVRNAEKGRVVAERYGMSTVVPSLREILEGDVVDLVVVAPLHGFTEIEVFAPGLVKAKELLDSGAIGR